MKKNLITSVLMTLATTILLGVIYPLVVTGLAQLLFHHKANGQLISKSGRVVGSRIIGQGFSGPDYFHSRPSAAGNGYDAANSAGSNLGPTNQKLIARVHQDVTTLRADNRKPVPIDLVPRPHRRPCCVGEHRRASARRGEPVLHPARRPVRQRDHQGRRAKGECAGTQPCS